MNHPTIRLRLEELERRDTPSAVMPPELGIAAVAQALPTGPDASLSICAIVSDELYSLPGGGGGTAAAPTAAAATSSPAGPFLLIASGVMAPDVSLVLNQHHGEVAGPGGSLSFAVQNVQQTGGELIVYGQVNQTTGPTFEGLNVQNVQVGVASSGDVTMTLYASGGGAVAEGFFTVEMFRTPTGPAPAATDGTAVAPSAPVELSAVPQDQFSLNLRGLGGKIVASMHVEAPQATTQIQDMIRDTLATLDKGQIYSVVVQGQDAILFWNPDTGSIRGGSSGSWMLDLNGVDLNHNETLVRDSA